MLMTVTEINTFYEESHILQGISLEIDLGEVVSLLGRNGVGKTTTLKSIMGLVPPKSGEVLFKGVSISRLPAYEIAKRGVGYVPEDRRIFPRLTVNENLIMGIKPGQEQRENGWSIEKIYGYFPSLKARDKQKGAHLSGGEQQMLTIARALMGNPEVILLDEPTEGLAPLIVKTVEQVVRDIHDHGVAILLVEQNMRVALRLASRFYIMSKGKIVFHGSSQALMAAEDVRKQYLEV